MIRKHQQACETSEISGASALSPAVAKAKGTSR